MKIAILGPISTAGITPFLFDPPPACFPVGYVGAPFMNTLIAELLTRGHEVFAITCGGYEAKRNSKPVTLKGKNFEYYSCPSRKHSIRPSSGRVGRILDFFAYERRNMQDVLAKVQPDIIHAHWTYEFAMAAMESGIPYLVTAHDDPKDVLKQMKNVYRFGRYFMARRVLRNAKAITAVSDHLKRMIQPLALSEISVVPNPLSRQFITAGIKRNLSSLSPAFRLISINNGWGTLKNVFSALLAFAHIREQVIGATYHLYGLDYQPRGPAEQWAKAEGLAAGVVFHGHVPHRDLVSALKEATLMLHPSRLEACPMGIAEAMALGLPVVGGAKSGGVPWMIGEAGLLVNINEPRDIANAALQLLTDDVLYDKYANAALQRARAFSPELIAAQYEKIYLRILKYV